MAFDRALANGAILEFGTLKRMRRSPLRVIGRLFGVHGELMVR
jgi:hypothetical protein